MKDLHRGMEITAYSFQHHLESAFSQGSNPPEFNLYQPPPMHQPSMNDLRITVNKRVREIERLRKEQLERLLTRTPMHARQDTDLLSPADLTQRRQRTRVRPTSESGSEEPAPRRKRVKPTCDSPSEGADLEWAAPENIPVRSRKRPSCFPPLPPETAVSDPHYSKFTLMIHKQTLMAYVLLDHIPTKNMYFYMSLYLPDWHRAQTSPHLINLPNADYHIIGNA
jgi:hypothetical protein